MVTLGDSHEREVPGIVRYELVVGREGYRVRAFVLLLIPDQSAEQPFLRQLSSVSFQEESVLIYEFE